MRQRIMESEDGRFWLPVEDHPQTDETYVVVRALQSQGDGSWAVRHTAVMTRSDLKSTPFYFGE